MDNDILELKHGAGFFYLGCVSGLFSDRRTNQSVNYFHIYAISDFPGSSGGSMSYGYKADKFKATPDAVKQAALCNVGDRINLVFDQYSRVTAVTSCS